MQAQGILQGLTHQYAEPLEYKVVFDTQEMKLNEHIGKKITMTYAGDIRCIHCGRKTKKTFNIGSCYPCFKKLPENDLCIVKPHECHYDQGTCRDPAWGEKHCMIPHYVYLAISSDMKVGLTRKHNQWKRWGDQGASYAVPIAEVPDRKTAGELEMAIAAHIPDKTNWRKMLRGEIPDLDLQQMREEVIQLIPEQYHAYILKEEEIVSFTYPMLEKLDKIKSYNLDKNPIVQDRLIGIKGQYLIFSDGVMNMRKFAGYQVSIQVEEE